MKDLKEENFWQLQKLIRNLIDLLLGLFLRHEKKEENLQDFNNSKKKKIFCAINKKTEIFATYKKKNFPPKNLRNFQ